MWRSALVVAIVLSSSAARAKCPEPPLRTWRAISSANAPVPSAHATMHWDGHAFVSIAVPFGDPQQLTVRGRRYDPCTDTWKPISDRGAFELPASDPHTTVSEYYYAYSQWVGDELYVVRPPDERGKKFPGIAAVYNTRTDSWSSRPASHAPGPGGVWVGTHVVMWGSDLSTSDHIFGAGYIYDWATDVRTPIAKPDAPARRQNEGHVELALGADRLFVWGGWDKGKTIDTGAILDVVHDTWSPITAAGAPGPRTDAVAAFTGHEVIVWGGLGDPYKRGRKSFADGGRYDPATKVWKPMSSKDAPVGRRDPIVHADGTKLLVFAGTPGDGDIFMQTYGPVPPTPGGIYDAAADRWTPIPTLAWKEVERSAMFGPKIDQLAIRSRQGIAIFDHGRWTTLPGTEAVERRGDLSGFSDKLLLMIGGEHVSAHGVGCGAPHPGYGCDPYDKTTPVTGAQIIRLF